VADLNAISAAPRLRLAGDGFRHQTPDFDARSGEGARRLGGRFNPRESFPVIYLCTTMECVRAEFVHLARRQGLEIEDLMPRELWHFELELEAVLDLTDTQTLAALELEAADLVQASHALTRAIGEAAHEQRFQAIRSHSATGTDDIIAVFTENLAGGRMSPELLEVWQSAADLDAV
jgi:RES domain-containing protein